MDHTMAGWDDGELTPQERARYRVLAGSLARRVVASAHDAADAALLLDMLGLDPADALHVERPGELVA